MKIIVATELPEIESLYNLYEELEWNTFLQLKPEQLLKAMEGSYYSVYAYEEGKLIATGRIVSDGIINAYLCGLGVSPQYRHHGIATKMINRMVQHCKENNLHVQFFCEEHLVPFYENMCFEKFAIGMKAKEGN